jgi:dehydrogenase/reductase SDR family member 12
MVAVNTQPVISTSLSDTTDTRNKGVMSLNSGPAFKIADSRLRLPEPTVSRLTALKSTLVIPAIAGFTRCGVPSSSQLRGLAHGCMTGRRVVVTGSTSGIGLAVVRQIAALGATVVLIARDASKAQQVCDGIRSALSKAATAPSDVSLIVELCDMAVLAEVAALAQRLGEIDVLINNCGVLVPKGEPKQFGGTAEMPLEITLVTNLLSHFVLTNLVKFRRATTNDTPGGAAWRRPRVINVSSGGMYSTKLFPDDLSYKESKTFDGVDAYARTKRAQMVLTELWSQVLFEQYGAAVHCMHPGWVDTPGVRQSLPSFYKWTHRLSMLRTADEGADTITWLACSDEDGPLCTSGGFWLDRAPQLKHMSSGTVESPQERIRLWNHLASIAEASLCLTPTHSDANVRFPRLE